MAAPAVEPKPAPTMPLRKACLGPGAVLIAAAVPAKPTAAVVAEAMFIG